MPPSFSEGAMEIGLQDADVSVDIIPENPQPYQEVTITLTSYATDLNKAIIEWKSGSSVVSSGYGKTRYSFKASEANTSVLFQVTITPAGSSESFVKQVIITPSEVEILWEGLDSYTPPFYRGKSFVSPEGLIRAVAVPNTGVAKSKNNITYTWKNGDNTVLGVSGYNKDAYIFANNELNKSEKVSVSASSVDGRYSASKTISIPIIDPQVIFYRKSPTEGTLYNTALANETFIESEEFTVVAVPYFLSLKDNEDKFSYDWKINGKSIDTPSKRVELTLRPASRGGYATIGLTLENLSTLFQKVTGQLKINL